MGEVEGGAVLVGHPVAHGHELELLEAKRLVQSDGGDGDELRSHRVQAPPQQRA